MNKCLEDEVFTKLSDMPAELTRWDLFFSE